MRSFARRIHVRLAWTIGAVLVAALSISVALLVTPMQRVDLVGQSVSVGAAAPSISLSGPGELDLFGQRLPTTLQFVGPVRPRLALTQITLGRQLATAFASRSPEQTIGKELASGWKRYFGWEIAITAGCALLLTGALAGWFRLTARRTLITLAAGLVFAEVVNVGGIMVTAYTAPDRLRQVTSITALAGRAPLPGRAGGGGSADAPGAGRGHGGLHGRRHRQPETGPPQPARHGLPAQRRHLRGRPGPDQQLAGAESGLQRRHHPGRHPRTAGSGGRPRARPVRGGQEGHERRRT